MKAFQIFAAGLLPAILLPATLWAAPAAHAEPAGVKPKTVVELFTSQGCSSCPPADVILGRLAERGDVIALSFSVDYWDYLGWRDTLADPDNTERQRAYARQRGDGQIFTPQMVVDGDAQVVGNNEAAIEEAVARARRALAIHRVPIGIRTEGDTSYIDIGAAKDGDTKASATLWLALVVKVARVKIARGENGGRTLVYHHVVRQIMPIGMWKGEAITLQLPQKALKRMDADMGVALLQAEGGGAVIAAAELPVR